ncbi:MULTISPECIES: MBL fold metallo-hydrolase [Clostridium]|uniref:MBL fold metallo-hydrolase n=1 Tax=Clostridium frigoriphilum TaxID=443253 RepID=A0ABU7URR7_9CLOT|nr:MBL fold metallo-hydrolase [Clostridium sp. DSM 17811]MBU3100636.1 MBL fold metallo-hydrolase [Clostridium sp. DSM 17811]
MVVSKGLNIIELGNDVINMNPILILDEEKLILIDTGLPEQLGKIAEEVSKAGVSIKDINKIILTHQDLDHIGNLASIIKNTENYIEVLAHIDEKPYIQGDKSPIKMTPEKLNVMSEEERNSRIDMFNKAKANVTKTIEDGEILDYCGVIDVIHTPGHTPGHACFYLRKYKTLVAGDAMNVMDGKLVGPNPTFTLDMKQAIESLKKLLNYDIKTVICYHGGIFTDRPKERIVEIINSTEY